MIPRCCLVNSNLAYQRLCSKMRLDVRRYQQKRREKHKARLARTRLVIQETTARVRVMIFHGHSGWQRIYFVEFIYLFPFFF